MDIGTAMSVVQTLLAALECSQLKDFCSKESLSSQIDQLQLTVKRIQGVLEDAESKHVLSKHEEAYLDELKDVVYEADDLFDEFLTLAHQRKLNDGFKNRLSSLFTKLKVDYNISQKVDKIKQKLDHIASTNQLICFKHDPEPIKMRSRETCSYVYAVDIIGRDVDLEKIVTLLLDCNVKQSVSFLSIVGIGGLGKTALAQLVFNDPRVSSAFQLKLWTCVSDQDQIDFDEKEIIRKILEAATNNKHHDATKDQLQCQLRQLLERKKYLLVLDDVWTENRDQWCKLVDFLIESQRGSWILVTTRSRRTAAIVGDGLMHELEGLSKENSWLLFKRVAFGSELSNPPGDLVNIAQKIVEKCANVPLAIRVAGSLLYGQEKRKWIYFQEHPLTKFEENKSGIMPILKLSYQQLESPLKSCFGYCALFPKDYVLEKQTLLKLWMAQGYIPSCDQRSMEDVAEEYFLVLLRRCFFQDVMENGYGDVYSCKIHDLMHDVAQEIVGKEICLGDAIVDNVNKNVRHFSLSGKECKSYIVNNTRIRSFVYVGPYVVEDGKMEQLSLDDLLRNWRYLRALDLRGLNIKSLSSSLGELIHLRYLNLSDNYKLKMLPRQITKLYNLETLNLLRCWHLTELPKDMRKLVKLRTLDILGCRELGYMPRGMRNLSCLEELTMFVDEGKSSSRKVSSGLEDLKALTNLKGDLRIMIGIWKNNDENEEREGGREGGCLSNKPHLTGVELWFSEEKSEGREENDEKILEGLQPHSNLKRLEVWRYQGRRMPNWAREGIMSNLVKIGIHSCLNLESMGCLGTFQHLKYLELDRLLNLDCLSEINNTRQDICDAGSSSVSSKEEHKFAIFPSLKALKLWELPKLKEWWRGVGMRDNQQLLKLPQLKKLHVCKCSHLTAIVKCSVLEDLYLCEFNEKFVINSMRKIEKRENGDGDRDEKHILKEATTIPSSFSSSPFSTSNIPKLRKITVDNLAWLNSQHIDLTSFQCLQTLELQCDKEVQSLGEGRDVFCSCSSSLRSLEIVSCSNLESVSGGLEHLNALEMLKIDDCPKLMLSEGESVDVDGMPWKSFNNSLCTLKFQSLPQLVNLPSWIQDLIALQTLEIRDCKNLELLPSWMPKLTSLNKLRLNENSARLEERCKELTGEDWPHIRHISTITFERWN